MEASCISHRHNGYTPPVLTSLMFRLGLRGWIFHAAALSSVGLCIALWIRAKTLDQSERGNAERRALFAGLWAPTLWGIGTSLEQREQRPRLRRPG